MIDLFYDCKGSNVASYVGGTTPYSSAADKPCVVLELQASATKVSSWFKNNHSKVNPEKCHILLSMKKHEIVSTYGIPLAASSNEKLLGVTTDSELKFDNHITEFCLKDGKKA